MVNVSIDSKAESAMEENEAPQAYARIELPKGSGVRVAGMSGVAVGADIEVVLKGRLEEKTEVDRSSTAPGGLYPPSGVDCRLTITSISITPEGGAVSLDEAVKASAQVM